MSIVLFDLDGTITDTFEGISRSIIYALDKYGIAVDDVKKLTPFIGPPLYESFSKYYGFSAEKAVEAVKYYREYYSVKGIYENTVYAGLEDALKELTKTHTLAVATSKPEGFSKEILARAALDKYFVGVFGATLDGKRIEKYDIIAYALSALGATSAIMVGDRKHDIEGAKQNNIKSVGVLYGFGDRAELEEAGADVIVSSPSKLPAAINALCKTL